MSKETLLTHRGSCHCGRVEFEVNAPQKITVQECNCSICSMVGYLHLIVPKSRFRLLKGKEFITVYTFNTEVAKHTFCRVCGVKPFYIPRSNPDGYSVNVRCLDKSNIKKINIEQFDGKNWEENAGRLAHLSTE